MISVVVQDPYWEQLGLLTRLTCVVLQIQFQLAACLVALPAQLSTSICFPSPQSTLVVVVRNRLSPQRHRVHDEEPVLVHFRPYTYSACTQHFT